MVIMKSVCHWQYLHFLPHLVRRLNTMSWPTSCRSFCARLFPARGNIRGFVDATAMAGLGHNRANILSVSTSQGFQYTSWFYMGVGLGVDVAFSNYDGSLSRADVPGYWGARRQ